jgi:methylenetetrahydrofolate reductase (NADPH)
MRGGDAYCLQLSFEFFPPKTEEMERTLWASVERLAGLQPSFVSVTYGADGSTRERTHRVVARIAEETPLTAVPHLTCVGASKAEIRDIAERYWSAGLEHVVVLRGDPPQGVGSRYEPDRNGYAYARDLVEGLKRIRDFEISVACYPEGHPESPSPKFDLDCLKRKVDAGASRAISQFFFDNDVFLRFRDRARAAGIEVPIIPGIMPVTNFAQMKRFAARCGASVPAWLERRFEGLDDDPQTRNMIAASTAIEQTDGLRREGIGGFHFYTLNRAELTYAICHAIGFRHKAAA